MASDSQITYSSEDAGSRKHACKKLFRKRAFGYDVIIATAGEGAPGMIFFDWYGKKSKPPAILADTDFVCLVLDSDGLWEFDKYCRAEKIEELFYAIGTGGNVALGAMHRGASAREAVEIAKLVDPYTGGEVVTMSLKK